MRKLRGGRIASKIRDDLFVIVVIVIVATSVVVTVAVIAKWIDSRIPFRTIDKGQISYIGIYDLDYKGEFRVIKDQNTWRDFWLNHTRGITPQPDVPTNISWDKEMVLVAIMEVRMYCCGHQITFISAYRNGDTIHAHLEKIHDMSPFPSLTCPFHIIAIEKAENVTFEVVTG